jgi:PIN domain nuclease of toxin-antitoxin system
VRLLLDTHAFLWWVMDDPRLSGPARQVLGEAANEVWLSAASALEVAMKAQRGRLRLPQAPERFVPRQLQANGFHPLPIRIEHALRVGSLPEHHRDPFDRLLIAQAVEDSLTIVTMDPRFRKYAIKTIW